MHGLSGRGKLTALFCCTFCERSVHPRTGPFFLFRHLFLAAQWLAIAETPTHRKQIEAI